MENEIVMHLYTTCIYAALSALAWRATLAKHNSMSQRFEQILLAAALIIHGYATIESVFSPNGMRMGFALALSGALWIGLMVYWIESLFLDIAGARILLLPLASAVTLLPALFPAGRLIEHLDQLWLKVHLAIALSAYSIITVAALHAVLMAGLDRRLHSLKHLQAKELSVWQRAFDSLPPLLTLEKLLFRLIGLGFLLLTLTIISGMVFSEMLFGLPMRLDHKNLFTLLSWLVFGALLMGRLRQGWRGRVALRWTLVGVSLLLIAYTGSRFVLDILVYPP